MINDVLITDPNDELYDLQQKYGVKISRSNSSDAVYFYKTKKKQIRVGHAFAKESGHLMNFKRNKVVKGKVTKEVVEQAIKAYINEL